MAAKRCLLPKHDWCSDDVCTNHSGADDVCPNHWRADDDVQRNCVLEHDAADELDGRVRVLCCAQRVAAGDSQLVPERARDERVSSNADVDGWNAADHTDRLQQRSKHVPVVDKRDKQRRDLVLQRH